MKFFLGFVVGVVMATIGFVNIANAVEKVITVSATTIQKATQ